MISMGYEQKNLEIGFLGFTSEWHRERDTISSIVTREVGLRKDLLRRRGVCWRTLAGVDLYRRDRYTSARGTCANEPRTIARARLPFQVKLLDSGCVEFSGEMSDAVAR